MISAVLDRIHNKPSKPPQQRRSFSPIQRLLSDRKTVSRRALNASRVVARREIRELLTEYEAKCRKSQAAKKVTVLSERGLHPCERNSNG